MSLSALAVLALAFLADRIFVEYPEAVHPVALFGRCVEPLDRDWRRPRLMGAAIATVLPLVAAGAVASLVAAASHVPLPVPVAADMLAVLVAGAALFAATSLRMLLDVAREVLVLVEEDLPAAQSRLRALAGRDATELSPEMVRSAVVESAAENLSDGLVAPLLAFAIGALISLPVAVGAATWVKAVNTLDSTLGYPSKPHGSASARLDDAVMLLPARLSAALLAVAALDPIAPLRAREAAQAPASPNAGWPMATVASVVGVRLEKPGAYVLGEIGRLPTSQQSRRGVAVVERAGLLAWTLAGLVVWDGAGSLQGVVP